MPRTSQSRALAAAIRSLARTHNTIANRTATANFVIEALRDRGQIAEARELERLVDRIKTQRAAAKAKLK